MRLIWRRLFLTETVLFSLITGFTWKHNGPLILPSRTKGKLYSLTWIIRPKKISTNSVLDSQVHAAWWHGTMIMIMADVMKIIYE